MNIQTLKYNLIEELTKVQDEDILKSLLNLLKKEKIQKYEESLKPMTMKELEEKLKRSEIDIREGRVYSTEEARKIVFNKK